MRLKLNRREERRLKQIKQNKEIKYKRNQQRHTSHKVEKRKGKKTTSRTVERIGVWFTGIVKCNNQRTLRKGEVSDEVSIKVVVPFLPLRKVGGQGSLVNTLMYVHAIRIKRWIVRIMTVLEESGLDYQYSSKE